MFLLKIIPWFRNRLGAELAKNPYFKVKKMSPGYPYGALVDINFPLVYTLLIGMNITRNSLKGRP